MRRIISGLLATAFLLGTVSLSATTLQIDPANADGVTKFVSLNAAGRYLVANALDVDGQPDEILVMVDAMDSMPVGETEGGYKYQGNDDLVIDGDGDNNGVWCTLTGQASDLFNTVGNSQNVMIFFYHEDASPWTASVEMRNFILIPAYEGPGTVISGTPVPALHGAIGYDMGTNADTNGSLLVENVVVTGSLSNGLPADPFTDSASLVTRFSRGIVSLAGAGAVVNSTEKIATQFRNVVLSMFDNDAIFFAGRNENATFGPGLVISYVSLGSVVNIQASTLGSSIQFAGTAVNRNVIYGCPTPNNATIITATGDASTSLNMAYTDLIDNGGTRQIRIDMPMSQIDNMILAEMTAADNGEGHIELFESGATPLLFSNCTFFNAGNVGTKNRLLAVRLDSEAVTIENCIFAASTGEADGATSATCDVAIGALSGVTPDITSQYSLYPETGPNALRKPAGPSFPPNPATDSAAFESAVTFAAGNSNIDPQFVSTNVADYPLPADLAAWRTTKITLLNSSYLRPDNVALLGAGPSAFNLHGAWTTYNVPVELSELTIE